MFTRIGAAAAVGLGVLVALASSNGAAPSGAPLELDGARFADGAAHIGAVAIALAAFGRGEPAAVDPSACATRVGDEVRFERAPSVTEWWRSVPAGLEQGVTIGARPVGDGPLVLEMSVGDGVVPEGEETISLRGVAGTRLATYSALSVVDRDGAVVPSHMAASAGRIRIEVDDRDAAYPLVVDPLVIVEEAAPMDPAPFDQDYFGSAVALTADGTLAIVGSVGGGMDRSDELGSVQLFRWTGAAWTAGDIEYGGSGSAQYMGLRVDITPDGTRAITMSRSNVLTVFRIEAGALVQETSIVSACRTGFSTNRTDGPDVEISDDGSRIVLGHYNFGTTAEGCAYVYARTGTTWAEEASFRARTGFGTAVAISGDGSRFAVIAPESSPLVDRVEVYARTGSTWAPEATIPLADNPTHISMDASGARFVVSLSSRPAEVYVRTGTSWARETALGSAACRDVAIDGGGNRVAALLAGGSLEVWRRSGATWTVAGTTSVSGALEVVALSENGRILVGAPQDASGGIERGRVRSFATGLGVGDACAVNGDCTLGFCADGVCCSTACGGGDPNDCQACSAALTGGANGTCGALSSGVAPTVTCRPAADDCDRPEVCTSASIDCPANTAMPGGTICRPSAGPCDFVERCDGTSFACAADTFEDAGTPCGGTATGDCVTPGVCDGTSVMCAGGTPRPSTTLCLPRAPGNPCDLDDYCDGVIGVCVPTYASATTSCGPPATDVCDAPDFCSGTSADCVPEYLTGICRPLAGPCDAVEMCSGDRPDCPDDGVLPSTLVCRPSTATCDPVEACDGINPLCPLDVTCEVPDTGVPIGADAGPTVPVAAAGCSCRVGGRGAPGAFVVLLALLVAARRPRRRR